MRSILPGCRVGICRNVIFLVAVFAGANLSAPVVTTACCCTASFYRIAAPYLLISATVKIPFGVGRVVTYYVRLRKAPSAKRLIQELLAVVPLLAC